MSHIVGSILFGAAFFFWLGWDVSARRRRCRRCVGADRALRIAWASYAEDTERLANALRRIKDSIAQFDSPTYESAAAYGGQILLMRQTIEAALNPSRVEASAASARSAPEIIEESRGGGDQE